MARRLRDLLFVIVASLAAAVSASAQSTNPFIRQLSSPPGNADQSTVVNPYLPSGPIINPYFQPYLGITGGTLHGAGEMLRGYSTVVTTQEKARGLREQFIQAGIDTSRKRFDFERYVHANLPTKADHLKRASANHVKRLYIAPQRAEILSGKALNVVIDDLRSFPVRKPNSDPVILSESTLSLLNITGKTNGVGLLRHGGKLTWPAALVDLLTTDQQRVIEAKSEQLVASAEEGKVDRQLLADLDTRMAEVRKMMTARVNDITPGRYLAADRFLEEFRDARRGIEDGQMATHKQFRKFIQGGKSVSELVEYLVKDGLRFAPATSEDEPAYRALLTALAAFDIALHVEGVDAAAKGGPTPP